jgi:hypothetical protein
VRRTLLLSSSHHTVGNCKGQCLAACHLHHRACRNTVCLDFIISCIHHRASSPLF